MSAAFLRRPSSQFVCLAFLAGIGIGLLAGNRRVLAMPQSNTRAADLAAIEKLHKADVECTLTQDPKCLTTLWSDDGIKVDTPGGPVVGIKALGEMYAKVKTDYPEFKVLRYTNDVTDVQIVANWAIEVGYSEATYQMSAKDKPVIVPRMQGMRVVKRQSDGSWKFALVGLQ
jgi:uncharacterized protein (TIGR02246 family)